MPRFVSATYHPDIKVAEFICDDGRHLLRCGGTLPWRINNCGDLKSPVNTQGLPAPRKTKNYIGFAGVPAKSRDAVHYFFIFPDYESGREQLKLCLRRLHGGKTLPEMAKAYAPPSENDTEKYSGALRALTGLDTARTVAELNEPELNQLADAIEKLEGYHNDAAGRKEVWVPVSRITATDGARPMADEEIVLRLDGKDTSVKSNRYGQLPPIAHSRGKLIEVLHKRASGELKSVGTIGGDNGQHFSVATWVQRFFAMPGPDQAPEDAPSRRAPMAYTVQPKDTLSKLALKFATTVDRIKQDNRLKRDEIFVGQQLGIHGPLPRGGAAIAPKHVAPKADASAKGKAPPANEAATSARSKSGTGRPIALVRTDQRLAPWMTVAFREATTYAGKDEAEITKTHNYHRLVTDDDRSGGRRRELTGKDGKPRLDKDGKPVTKTSFDGLASLAGDNNPWCASFVNYCLKEANYAPGRRHMSSYTFGEDRDLFVRIHAPVYGAIRFSRRRGGGHVCFVYGAIEDKLVTLGGNQDNQICFQLRSVDEPGAMFFVPFPYKEFSNSEAGALLPEPDIAALRKEFGSAIQISDAEINATRTIAKAES